MHRCPECGQECNCDGEDYEDRYSDYEFEECTHWLTRECREALIDKDDEFEEGTNWPLRG